jgi:hypothetical protein
MSRFSEEMSVIPRQARVIAIVAALTVPFAALCFVFVVRLNPGHGSLAWVPFAALAGIAVMLVVATYILLVGYIVGDSRRRGMRPLLWALLAIFITNAIGIILYFILRDPLLQHCTKCGAGAQAAFTFCAVCGEAISRLALAAEVPCSRGGLTAHDVASLPAAENGNVPDTSLPIFLPSMISVAGPRAFNVDLAIVSRCDPSRSRIRRASPISIVPSVPIPVWIPVAADPDVVRCWPSRNHPDNRRRWRRSDSETKRHLAECRFAGKQHHNHQ